MVEYLPCTLALPAGAQAHPGGWYLLMVRPAAAQAVPDRLYLQVEDAGPPCAHEACMVLPQAGPDGRVRALVRLRMDTQVLRLGGLHCGADPVPVTVRLRRVGKLRALAAMLALVWTRATPRAALGLLAQALWRMLRGGLRAGGDAAYARYRALLGDGGGEYAGWVLRQALAPEAQPAALQARLAALPHRPRVSLVLPVHAPPERWLRACLDSVLAQVYPQWELCIADDASPTPRTREVLAEYQRRDERIRVVTRPRNGHIAAASNSALALATGDWVALLDHDDMLAPQALLAMVEAAQAHPQWRLLYSDEDKIDADGRRFDPYFKPDFNYPLLLGQNCICHLGMYAADLLREVGGFHPGVDGSQDWDLALRCVERLQPAQIGHVPQVLYHWRAIPGSTATAAAAKDYATAAAQRAVQAHLDRTGQAARATIAAPGRIRVHRALPVPPPRVSLIVPTRDRVDLLRTCLHGLLERTDYPALDVLVVDNQSRQPETHAYLETVARDPRVRVLRIDAPFNYSAINNAAARQAQGDVLGLINNDIEVLDAHWLREMVAEAVVPQVGAVGALLLYPDMRIQHAGVILGIGGVAGHPWCGMPRDSDGQMGRLRQVQALSAVTGACLLLRRAVFDAVGGLDEALPVAFNDVDLCLRIRAAGYRNVWTPHAVLVHNESATRGYDTTAEKNARLLREAAFMQARWGAELLSDPAYNPNLDLDGNHFGLAAAPRERARGGHG